MNNLHRELAPIFGCRLGARSRKRLRGRSSATWPVGGWLICLGAGGGRTVSRRQPVTCAKSRLRRTAVFARLREIEAARRATGTLRAGSRCQLTTSSGGGERFRLANRRRKRRKKRSRFSEDGAIFDGLYGLRKIGGIRQGTSNPIMTLPTDVTRLPGTRWAQALSQLRLVGVV